MNANGRLTTPPLDEVALVTNSVCDTLNVSRLFSLTSRGNLLEISSIGLSSPPNAGSAVRSRNRTDLRFWTQHPAAAAHSFSDSAGVAA